MKKFTNTVFTIEKGVVYVLEEEYNSYQEQELEANGWYYAFVEVIKNNKSAETGTVTLKVVDAKGGLCLKVTSDLSIAEVGVMVVNLHAMCKYVNPFNVEDSEIDQSSWEKLLQEEGISLN